MTTQFIMSNKPINASDHDSILQPLSVMSVYAALNQVLDPCSVVAGVPAGLVDMGLINHVAITFMSSGDLSNCQVSVTLQLTEPGCLMAHAFIPAIHNAVKKLPGAPQSQVRLDPHAVWDESCMTPDYRARLNQHRNPTGGEIELKHVFLVQASSQFQANPIV
jgi:metal-sulfur cluster biosynthetic enzyme